MRLSFLVVDLIVDFFMVIFGVIIMFGIIGMFKCFVVLISLIFDFVVFFLLVYICLNMLFVFCLWVVVWFKVVGKYGKFLLRILFSFCIFFCFSVMRKIGSDVLIKFVLFWVMILIRCSVFIMELVLILVFELLWIFFVMGDDFFVFFFIGRGFVFSEIWFFLFDNLFWL